LIKEQFLKKTENSKSVKLPVDIGSYAGNDFQEIPKYIPADLFLFKALKSG
jgi:hypothetical protein